MQGKKSVKISPKTDDEFMTAHIFSVFSARRSCEEIRRSYTEAKSCVKEDPKKAENIYNELVRKRRFTSDSRLPPSYYRNDRDFRSTYLQAFKTLLRR